MVIKNQTIQITKSNSNCMIYDLDTYSNVLFDVDV